MSAVTIDSIKTGITSNFGLDEFIDISNNYNIWYDCEVYIGKQIRSALYTGGICDVIKQNEFFASASDIFCILLFKCIEGWSTDPFIYTLHLQFIVHYIDIVLINSFLFVADVWRQNYSSG